MDFEKFTERARGFVQSAQGMAVRESHQQFTPEHLLKVLLDDPEGLCAGLIQRAGGRPEDALAGVEQAVAAARDLGARIVSNDRYRDWAADHPEVATPGHLVRGGYREGALWLDLD